MQTRGKYASSTSKRHKRIRTLAPSSPSVSCHPTFMMTRRKHLWFLSAAVWHLQNFYHSNSYVKYTSIVMISAHIESRDCIDMKICWNTFLSFSIVCFSRLLLNLLIRIRYKCVSIVIDFRFKWQIYGDEKGLCFK